MNICILTHTFPRNSQDSTAAFMKEFAYGLALTGDKVFVLTPYDELFGNSDNRFKVVTYKYIWPGSMHRLGYSRAMKADVSLKLFNFFLLPFMILFGTLSLIKLVLKEKIDLINVHWILPNGPIALFTAIVTGIPYVITLPGTDVYLVRKNKIFAFVAKLVASRSSGIISNSSLLLKRIMDLRVGDKPTAVIPYPVDTNFIKPSQKGVDSLRKKMGIAKDGVVIMAIGRLVYKKGFSYLIDALKEVSKKNRQAILIIGGDGDLKAELISQTKKLSLERKVIFVGNIPRDKILAYYNLADIFVAPSILDKEGNIDGGPVVSYESMAAGCPQIATNVLGVSDVIVNGVNGYVVSQKNSHVLARAINDLLSSKDLREKMGAANRKLILDKLNTKAIGLTYHEFFEKLTA